MAASSSASSWRGRGRSDVHGVEASRILNPGDPLDYSPDVLCKCESKAAKRVAWTYGNPGRRFYNCLHGKCDYFTWIDNATPNHLKPLLIKYRNLVRSMNMPNREGDLVMEATGEVLGPTVHEGRVMMASGGEDVEERCRKLGRDVAMLKYVLVGCLVVVVCLMLK